MSTLKQKLAESEPIRCRLIAWSLKDKGGAMRPPTCPECFRPAEVGLDMIGRPCYYHVHPPAFPFKKKRRTL